MAATRPAITPAAGHALALLLTLLPALGHAAPVYDIAINGGTVIDPETDTQKELNVGINGGTIVALSSEALAGKEVLDASGQYVVPGFIDLCSYKPFRYGEKFKAADGVTTALSLHSGTAFFSGWAENLKAKRPMLHYGASAHASFTRHAIGLKDRYAAATPKQIERLVKITRANLREGALGVSFSLEYLPGTSAAEVTRLGAVAAELGVPTFWHLRHSDPDPPGTNAEAVDEVISLARQTGVAVHIHHLTSTGGTFTMPATVAQIDAARSEGLAISANLYPYDFWATYLNSARFDPGWQERFRISYGDLQLAGSKRRLTRASFERLRKTHTVAAAYAIPEQDVRTGLKAPWMVIASDTIMGSSGNNHPRGAGCYARVIAKYVREEKLLTLADAIRRMTLMPAQVIEKAAPAMRKKGRLQVGMDADVVVFDLATIQDVATVEEPRQYSQGISYVLISGTVVRRGDAISYQPVGRLIRSEPLGKAAP